MLQMYKALVILSGVGLSIASFMDAARTVNADGNASDSSGMDYSAPDAGDRLQDRPQSALSHPTSRSGTQAASAARRHIASEPLAPLALVVIAHEEGSKKQSALQVAERITRRNAALQLELVNAAALTGDVASAVKHLDKALRVRPQLGTEILPKLVPAIADPDFREAMRVVADRPWVWQYLALAGKDQVLGLHAGEFVLESRSVLQSAQAPVKQSAIRTLLLAGLFREAQDLAVATGVISRQAMETFTPIAANSMHGLEPLTWRLARSEVAEVALSDDGTWQATIEPGRQASLMQRVTNLGVGDYRIAGRISADDMRVSLRMTVRCVLDNSKVVVAEWQAKPPQSLTLDMPFSVPVGCDDQIWMLDGSSLAADDPVSLSAGMLTSVTIND